MASSHRGTPPSVLCWRVWCFLLLAWCEYSQADAEAPAERTQHVLDAKDGVEQSSPNDQAACLDLAQHFIAQHGQHPSASPDADGMLYFLHIPRTAGRTYHACFLKQAHPPSKRCAKSYDVLRLNESLSDCGLLSSHDDFSVIDMLPENGAVITQLREPVDRVLSTYEFAMEVAARSAKGVLPPHDPSKVNTREVWPWSFLVPFLEKDIWQRLPKATKVAEEDPTPDRAMDPYNNEVTMPLHEFLNHPEVEDVIFNGATLQVLGLTNYSMWPEAKELRQCLPHSPAAQEALLQLALERLDHFAHVGVFDRLEDSMVSLAATVGIDLEGESWSGRVPEMKTPKSLDQAWMQDRQEKLTAQLTHISKTLDASEPSLEEKLQAGEDPKEIAKLRGTIDRLYKRRAELEQEQAVLQAHLLGTAIKWQGHWDDAYKNLYPLWRSYRHCVDAARKRNSQRRANSFRNLDLPDGRRFHFTSGAREGVDPTILDFIREKNKMDAALYEKGVKLLEAKLAEHKLAGRLGRMPSKEEANLADIEQTERDMAPQRDAQKQANRQQDSQQANPQHHHKQHHHQRDGSGSAQDQMPRDEL